MAHVLRMPEVAANTVEAVLQEWPITENTRFHAGDTIATVETDKAVVDVEAETDGVILTTLVPAGSAVEVGAPIAVLGEPGETVDDFDALLARLGVGPVPAAPAPERRTVVDPSPTAAAVPPAVPPAAVPPAAVPPAVDGRPAAVERIFASPLARRLAREARLPVEQIRGTGPGGRIVRRDVEAAIANRSAAAGSVAAAARVLDATAAARQTVGAAAAGSVAAPARATKPEPVERPTSVPAGRPTSVPAERPTGTPDRSGYVDQPHSRMRTAIAARLTESKRSAPHFYLRGTARVDRLLRLRERLNRVSPVKISVNDLVIKAAAGAHGLVPQMNVVWTPEAVRSFSSVDISVAVATERGLLTPVLRDVARLSISQIAAGVQELAGRAKTGRLRQDELDGGSLSITNLGMYGTEEFAAIINPPQAAILAVGAARQEPVVHKGKLTVGTTMRVMLSVDHRPVDGVVAAQWMRAFVSLVEDPLRILV